MILTILREKYDLSSAHIASLFSKTEKSLIDDLDNSKQLSNGISEILTNPKKLLDLLDAGKDKIPPTVYKRTREKIYKEIVDQLSSAFEGYVFLKQVKSNELGIRNNISRGAGSFILIPKESTQLFPKLDETKLNCHQVVSVRINPESEDKTADFVYHNSKHVEKNPDGRDEYRLYINNYIDDKPILKPNDIIMLKQSAVESSTYQMYHYNSFEPEYNKLLQIILKNKKSRAVAALVKLSEITMNNIDIDDLYDFTPTEEHIKKYLDSPLIEIEEPTTTIPSLQVQDEEIDSAVIEELLSKNINDLDPAYVVRVVNSIKRNAHFRKIVLVAYDNKCAITGQCISYRRLSNLQACHIIGKGYKGGDNPRNGITLNRDLHWAFDNGMFTIDNSYHVVVHKEMLLDEKLAEIDGKTIRLPSDEKFRPSEDALKYHREKIFGSFLRM